MFSDILIEIKSSWLGNQLSFEGSVWPALWSKVLGQWNLKMGVLHGSCWYYSGHCIKPKINSNILLQWHLVLGCGVVFMWTTAR